MPETFKINDIDYEFDFKLTNADKQEVTFTKTAVKAMTIVDSIFDPFITGSITVANPYDLIEDQYLIRGDGRDEFYIMFKPKEPPKDAKNGDKFEHSFAVISDSNSVNPNVRSENLKTFTLIDKNAIPFSDKIPYAKTYSGKVGDIIKTIFKDVLGKDSVDEKNWVSGDFQLEFIPPATYRYIDLLHHMMRLFYAKDGELYVKGLISYDPEKKKFRLDLISKIFEDNKKHIMEGFALGDLTDKLSTSNPNNPPPDAPTGEYIGPLKNFGLSTPLYGYNTDYFVNSLVFGYDPILGEHKIRKIIFDDIKKKWATKFVEVFKSGGGKPKPFAVKNKSTAQKFKRYNFPYPVEDGVKMVESEIHNNLIFYNLQATIANIGATNRCAGKFMDIYTTRDEAGKPLKSEEKMLGRWFVTEIRHEFTRDIYTNTIFATKTYVGPNSKISEDAE